MANLVKILRSLFIKGPIVALLGLVQLLFLLLFGILGLIVRLAEWLCEFLRRMNLKP